MIESYWFFVLAVPVVLITGISKGGFAGGLGTLAVPVLSLMVDPRVAAAIMLPILCTMDLFNLWSYRNKWDAVNLKIILPAAMIGILIGTLSFRYMDANLIKFMVGSVALYFVGHYLYFRFIRRKSDEQQPPRSWAGRFWGMVAGFTSFVAHAGGPPLSVYLFPSPIDKTKMMATSVVFFTTVNYVKLVPYFFLGQLSAGNLKTSLILLPLAPLGVWAGIWLHKRVSDKAFYVVCYALLFIAGVKLFYEGGMGTLLS